MTSLGAALLRNTLSGVGGRLAVNLLGIATFAILARTVGAHGLGQYRTVLTLLLFAGTVVDLGLYTVTLQALSGSVADQRRVLSEVIGLRITATTLAVLALGALVTLAEPDRTVQIGVLVAGLGWIGFHVNDVLRALFQQKLAQHHSAIAETAGAVATLVLVIACALAGGNVDWMLAATAVGLTVTGVVAWRLALRHVAFTPAFDRTAWQSLMMTGIPFAASGLLMTLHFRVDVLLLSILREPVDVGLYDVPAKLYELVFMGPYLFGGLLLPLFVRDLGGVRGTLAPRLRSAVGIVLLAGTLAAAVLLVHAEPIVVLLGGEQFIASAQPLRILGAAAVLAGVCAVMRYGVTALKRQHGMLYADLASLVVAAGMHLALIPRYGVMGAAVGRLSGDAVRTLLTLRLLRGQLTLAVWRWSALALTAGAALAAALVVLRAVGLHWIPATALCGLAVLGGCYLLRPVRRALDSLSAG